MFLSTKKASPRDLFVSPHQFAHFLPGEIVTGIVRNPLQDPNYKWKARPLVLLRREGAAWLVMGLTTLPNHADCTPRCRVPNPLSCGLGDGDSYLWGRASRVCALDIGDHIGYADEDLLAVLATIGVEVDMAEPIDQPLFP